MKKNIKKCLKIILYLFLFTVNVDFLDASLGRRLKRRERRIQRSLSDYGFSRISRNVPRENVLEDVDEVEVLAPIIDDANKVQLIIHRYGNYLEELDFIVDAINNYQDGVLNLNGLYINSELLEHLIPFISQLIQNKNLVNIDLSNNQISYLPNNWDNLSGLQHINLSQNRIYYFNLKFNYLGQDIPVYKNSLELMSKINTLSSLNLSRNETLQYFPFNLNVLRNFTSLDLTGTKVKGFVINKITFIYPGLNISQD